MVNDLFSWSVIDTPPRPVKSRAIPVYVYIYIYIYILAGYPPFGRDFLLVPAEGNGPFGPGVCLASLGKLTRPSGGIFLVIIISHSRYHLKFKNFILLYNGDTFQGPAYIIIINSCESVALTTPSAKGEQV